MEELANELSDLKENKIDLNKATIQELIRIPFITEQEAEAIIQYRKDYGLFLSLYELKTIKEIDSTKARQLTEYIKVEEEHEKKPLLTRLKQNKSDIYIRYDRTLEEKKGYNLPDSSKAKGYEGDPNHYYLKYKLQCSDLLHLGIVGEKDAGEKAWGGGNYAFDFVSAHLQFENIGPLKRICIGDFKANFGQGLIIGTSSIIGKSNNVLNSMQRTRGIFKYTSIGESGFLRGAGITLKHKNLDLTLLGSYKKIDSNISDGRITSFKTDGLHRTENEINKEKNTSEKIFGANITLQSSSAHIGATFLHYIYKDTLQPASSPYNKFRLQQTDRNWNGSIDYSIRKYRCNLFGEFATSQNGGYAIFNGARFYPNSRTGFLLMHRHYTKDYQANYANGFGENSRLENETGLYIGAEFKPFKRISLSMYADTYTFPWIRFSANKANSNGFDYLLYSSISLSKNSKLYFKYKEKVIDKNESDYGVSPDYKRVFRIGYRNKDIKGMDAQTIAEVNSHHTSHTHNKYGWIISQDVSYAFSRPYIKTSLRYAYFHTPDYANRIYIYEKDILHVFSIPSHYGEGHRLCLNTQFNLKRNIALYLKYAITIYTDERETISSGNEEIKGNKTSVFKALLRFRL